MYFFYSTGSRSIILAVFTYDKNSNTTSNYIHRQSGCNADDYRTLQTVFWKLICYCFLFFLFFQFSFFVLLIPELTHTDSGKTPCPLCSVAYCSLENTACCIFIEESQSRQQMAFVSVYRLLGTMRSLRSSKISLWDLFISTDIWDLFSSAAEYQRCCSVRVTLPAGSLFLFFFLSFEQLREMDLFLAIFETAPASTTAVVPPTTSRRKCQAETTHATERQYNQ